MSGFALGPLLPTPNEDGSVTMPDGTIVYPSGQVFTSGDVSVFPDGSVIDAQGNYYPPGKQLVPLPQPTQSGWQKFTTWLSQPVASGWPSTGAILGIAAVGTALFSMMGKRR